MTDNLVEMTKELIETKTLGEVSKILNLAPGTVKRWIMKEIVPPAYRFDLMKMAGKEIDYTTYDFKEKDQFYTPEETANECYTTFKNVIEGYGEDETVYTYIEPSAGGGSFLKALPKERAIGMDIEPKGQEIMKQDYLNWYPSDIKSDRKSDRKRYVVFGNPPFGLRGHMALRFINHSEFADYVCFILPQLFESDGKGVPRKRVQGFNLIYSKRVDSTFNYPDGREVGVNCIFQIWSKNHESPPDYKLEKKESEEVKIYSLSDGGTPSSTRNKKMFDKCDVYLPSTCFGKEKMKKYDNFRELPGCRGYGVVFLKERETNIMKSERIKWNEVAFLSTNGAYNLRSSQIENEFK